MAVLASRKLNNTFAFGANTTASTKSVAIPRARWLRRVKLLLTAVVATVGTTPNLQAMPRLINSVALKGEGNTSYFDISGEDFNRVLSEALKVDVKKAEIIKRMYGIASEHKSLQKVIKPLASAIVEKTKSIFDEIYLQDKERVGKIILSGGGAILPGFIDYFHTSLDVPVEIANPFLDINYHPTLETALKRLSPSFTIAVGMAQRGL